LGWQAQNPAKAAALVYREKVRQYKKKVQGFVKCLGQIDL